MAQICETSCNIPSSIAAYKKYGLHKSLLRHLLTEFTSFPENYRDVLDSYYLLYWTPQYLDANIKQGTITHSGKTYQVIFKCIRPLTRNPCAQVKLSFRSPKAEFDLPSYVIVSHVKKYNL
jgi:hypothetical protein